MTEEFEQESSGTFMVTNIDVHHGSLKMSGKRHSDDEFNEEREDETVFLTMDGLIFIGDDEAGYARVNQKQVAVLSRPLAYELLNKLPGAIVQATFHQRCRENGIDPEDF